MYRYDSYDQSIVNARVEEFRDQVQRRLTGALTEDQFKPLRLMNGLYLQLHAYMLRVAIPYGTLSGKQMRKLGEIAAKYDKGYGHFTTRQNLQYNWIKLADAPDILAELATVEMHAIQTSGNCIRNISSDQYAGVSADEVADPRPWAELLRQWSSFHPEFTYLPRKFKICVIASDDDRAAIQGRQRRDGIAEPDVGTVGQAAQGAGFTLSRNDAQGPDRVVIGISSARSPAFFAWLASLQGQGVIVEKLTLRTNSDATLSVEATLRVRAR